MTYDIVNAISEIHVQRLEFVEPRPSGRNGRSNGWIRLQTMDGVDVICLFIGTQCTPVVRQRKASIRQCTCHSLLSIRFEHTGLSGATWRTTAPSTRIDDHRVKRVTNATSLEEKADIAKRKERGG